MIIFVTLRETATGKERTFQDDTPRPWDETSDFIWREGNFACDCNRYTFWLEAAGEEQPDDVPCGDGRFQIVHIKDEAGNVLMQGPA